MRKHRGGGGGGWEGATPPKNFWNIKLFGQQIPNDSDVKNCIILQDYKNNKRLK